MDTLISHIQIAPSQALTLAPTLVSSLVSSLAFSAFTALMAFAALRGMAGGPIPDRLILALAATYATLAPLAGFAPREMLVALGVAAMIFFAAVATVALGWMDSGESKLLAVAALWLGPETVPHFLILALAFGGLAALSLASLRLLPAHGTRARLRRVGRRVGTSGGPPAVVPIALAACLSLGATPWLGAF